MFTRFLDFVQSVLFKQGLNHNEYPTIGRDNSLMQMVDVAIYLHLLQGFIHMSAVRCMIMLL